MKSILLMLMGAMLITCSLNVASAQPNEDVPPTVPEIEVPTLDAGAEKSIGEVISPPTEKEPENVGEAVGTIQQFFRDFRSRDYFAAFCSFIALLVFGLRVLFRTFTKWFEKSKWRMFGLAVGTAFLTELLTGMAASQSWSWSMLGAALGAAFGAAGIWATRPQRMRMGS